MGYTVVDNIDLPESYTKPEKSEAVSLNQCLELSPREKAKAKADSKTKAAS
jgi:hypothetical protein